jgi:hypothetical protein
MPPLSQGSIEGCPLEHTPRLHAHYSELLELALIQINFMNESKLRVISFFIKSSQRSLLTQRSVVLPVCAEISIRFI